MKGICNVIINILFLMQLVPAVLSSDPVTGSVVRHPQGDQTQLYIVAYSRDGLVVESAPVTKHDKFSFFTFRQIPGHYVLHLRGAIEQEYNSILIQINSQHRVAYVNVRKNAMRLPPPLDKDFEDGMENEDIEILFKPSAKTNYRHEKTPWRLKDLWTYKFRILQGIAVLFLVLFPQVIRSLPKEMREELTGEKEPDMANANDLYKILWGQTFSRSKSKSSR